MKFIKFLCLLPVRIALTVFLILFISGGLWLLGNGYVNIPCSFLELTGLYCPGCGVGRALKDILRFDFIAAFCHNPLAVTMGPFIGYYLVKMWVFYLFGRDILPFFKISTKAAIWILIAILAFWILRNIPVFPFNLLAP